MNAGPRPTPKSGLFDKRRMLLAGAALCLACGLAMGQRSPAVVQARMMLATDAAHPGSSVPSAVVAQISPGYHINDHKPTFDYLIPTELKLESNKQLSVEKIVYPKGEPKKFEFSDSPLSVYEGAVVVGAMLKLAQTAPPGVYTLNGKFVYQACNDRACLPPTSVPVALSVKVVGRGVSLKRVNGDVFNRIKFE